MHFVRQILRLSSGARALALVLAMLLGTSCVGDTPAGLRDASKRRASFSVRPIFPPTPPGGPAIPLTKMRGVLRSPSGQAFTVEATFQNGIATLVFDVQFTGSSADFTLELTAFDDRNQVAYTSTSQVRVVPGDQNAPQPELVYAAADAAVTAIKVNPSTLDLTAGASAALSVTGTANGQTVNAIRVGWTSRDPSIATVDEAGNVKAGSSQGATWIVARTPKDLADSVRVKVRAPIAKVVIIPGSVTVVRGLTAAVAAQLFDAGNHLIDDRVATFSVTDASKATVSAAGILTGVALGGTTVTATAEGVSGTAAVTVVSPVDHIDLSAGGALTFASINETRSLTATLVPRAGASVAGLNPTLTSSNPAVVSVSAALVDGANASADLAGSLVAKGNGSATITAAIDGITATLTVTVKQVAVSASIAPLSYTASALGETAGFKVTALDALGTALPDGDVTWSVGNGAIANVSSTGVATALAVGATSVTATVNGKTATASFNVQQIPRVLFLTADQDPIAVGQTTTIRGRVADGNGNIIGPVSPTFVSQATGIATISGAIVRGVSAGSARIDGSVGAMTASVTVHVQSVGGTALLLNIINAEKLPNGTQQFSVASGGGGPYVWSVNGIDGGNSTFGTIDGEGFYRAPSTVPNPATFEICARRQAAPNERGCATMTINPVPTSGADVIVFNDVNVFESPGANDPNNQQMYKNLVNFTGTGVRATKTGVLFYTGNTGETWPLAAPRSAIQGAGYTITTQTANFAAAIDPNIKVVFLWLPRTAFSVTQINILKAFAAEGGRIVYVGEYAGYYGVGISVENSFFASMGAQMTNAGGSFDNGFAIEPATSIRPHQVMTGVTQLTVAAASEVIPGPNDYPFLYDHTNTHVLAAAAKVDVTPIVALRAPVASPALNRARALNSATLSVVLDPSDPAGRPLVKKP